MKKNGPKGTNKNIYWTKNQNEILNEFNTDEEKGLNITEVKKRRKKFGKNKLKEHKTQSSFIIFINQFKSLIMIMLMIAAIVSFIFTQWIDGIAVSIAIIINVLIGFFTELNAVRSMEALQKMDKVSSKVLRDGEVKQISAEQIVPGDILVLESGDVITADSRVISHLSCR